MDPAEQEKIEKLYLEMYDMMMLYASSCLLAEELAEEAVQETFRIACQRRDKLMESANPKGWLVMTLRNVVRNGNKRILRERQCRRDGFFDGFRFPQEESLPLETLYADVADTEEFHLVMESELEGKTHAEMAQERGITVAACKKRLQRAKERLRKILAG